MTDRGYQVLARKWRPQKFDQVVGQSAIVRTLRNALEQGRVAHAYCFSGIRGVGKTTIARLLAKGLNCRSVDSPTAEPCGTCEACVEIEESRSLDVIELDAASQTGVDSIRQLNEVARYTPSRDRYRVFIIDEAHMLSPNAFNALLKTLEEPPPHVVFMLATTEPHKVLQTVLSRCQNYPLGRISQAEISGRLREIVAAEGVEISADGLAMVAIAADGSLRDAQSLLDKLIAFGGETIDDEVVADLLGMVDRELLFAATDLIADQDLAGVLGLVNGMVEQGVDLHQFTLDMLGHVRALLVVATVDDAGDILHLPDADLRRLGEQASRFEVDDLDRAFALLSASEYRIKQSEVPRYQLEMVLSRLARMPRLEPISALIQELRSGSGGGTPGGPGGARRGGGSGARARVASTAPAARPATRSAAPPAPASGIPSDADEPRPAPPGAEGPATVGSLPSSPPAGGNGAAGGEASVASTSRPADLDPAVSRVLDRLQRDKPLIAKIVERAGRIELRDDTLFLTFSESGIFKARLRDRSALETIEAAGEAALGRKIRVVAGFDDESAGAAASETAAAGAPNSSAAGGLERASERQRDELWKRVETEPLVQHFVEALRGNLTDVEEI
jgi:DNA polymerase-3 subunit gamma/tau